MSEKNSRARMAELLDQAIRLEPSTGPWKVVKGEEWAENWLIGSFGASSDYDDVHCIHVTTDQVHASELEGDAKTDAEFVAWCRNHLGEMLDWIAEQIEWAIPEDIAEKRAEEKAYCDALIERLAKIGKARP